MTKSRLHAVAEDHESLKSLSLFFWFHFHFCYRSGSERRGRAKPFNASRPTQGEEIIHFHKTNKETCMNTSLIKHMRKLDE